MLRAFASLGRRIGPPGQACALLPLIGEQPSGQHAAALVDPPSHDQLIPPGKIVSRIFTRTTLRSSSGRAP